MDDIRLMVQQEMVHTLQQEHEIITSASDCRSLGDDPDNPEEIISIEEAERRRIEKFLKDVLIIKQGNTKKASEGPSLEDFPPLPCAASSQQGWCAQKVFSDISPSSSKGLTSTKHQRKQRKKKQQFKSPLHTNKTATKEIQAALASKAHNEPHSQLSRSCQTGNVTGAENVSTADTVSDDGKMTKKQGRSNLPVFSSLHAGGKPMIEYLSITGNY